MTVADFAKSDDGLWHVAKSDKGMTYIRRGQLPPFMMREDEAKEMFEGLKEVLYGRDDEAA